MPSLPMFGLPRSLFRAHAVIPMVLDIHLSGVQKCRFGLDGSFFCVVADPIWVAV